MFPTLREIVGQVLRGQWSGIHRVIDEIHHGAIEWALPFERDMCAGLFHGATRTPVGGAYVKPDAPGPACRVPDHQLLHLGVGGAAPVFARQEGVTDGYFLPRRIPVVVARRADDPAIA